MIHHTLLCIVIRLGIQQLDNSLEQRLIIRLILWMIKKLIQLIATLVQLELYSRGAK